MTTRYIYGAGGNLLAEADGSNNITRYYIHGLGLLAMVTPTDQVYCYHFNGIGSTIAMTDQGQAVVNQYSYDSFGKILNQQETILQPFKFVGRHGVMTEPNGFYYMRARYYDPAVGRFVSEDPVGFEGKDVNLYAYVENNPGNAIDPSGKLAFYWHLGITYVAARDSGYGIWNSLKLAWKTMAVDFAKGSQDKTPEAVVQHGMGMPYQSSVQAITETNKYIQESISKGNFTGAIHAAQDLATPAHCGQPWNGFGFNSGTVSHLAGDIFPSSSTIKNAYNNTMSILNGSFGNGGK